LRKRENNIFAGIAATVSPSDTQILDFSTLYGKHIQKIGFGLILAVIAISIDSKFYERFSGVIYILTLVALVGLFLFGANINGATSWYRIGGFTLQPSEFAKVGAALALANFLSEPNRDLNNLKSQLNAFAILVIPAVLITLQPDAGSALIYASLVFVMYREGLPVYYIVIGLLGIVLFVVTLALGLKITLLAVFGLLALFFIYLIKNNNFAIKREWPKLIALYLCVGLFIFSVDYIYNNVFEKRHQDRFNILLGKTADTRGIGYNTDQSMITIGSGGLTGKGFLEGDRTQGKFVPEQHTDYIFSTVGEEWGFLGTTAVILLFTAFILRILTLAERQKSSFSRIFGYATAIIFFFHFMINVGMVIGLLPTIGIPLPFFSYGGSSLWGFTLLVFIFIRLDADKTYEW